MSIFKTCLSKDFSGRSFSLQSILQFGMEEGVFIFKNRSLEPSLPLPFDFLAFKNDRKRQQIKTALAAQNVHCTVAV